LVIQEIKTVVLVSYSPLASMPNNRE
jgi:hypothetical protein